MTTRQLASRLLATALFLSTSGAFASDGPGTTSDQSSPFGIHGPTYSHWLAFGRPNLWLEGEAHFQVLKETGAAWARQDFWWGLVEPERGRFVWDDFDRAVAAYQRHGLSLMPILCYASAWSGGVSPATDEERERFANYVYQMVNRYKGRISAWEIWNEPNIQPFWSPQPDPQLYTKLLQSAYAAAKQADPDCLVVGGALAGPDDAFLRGMYQAGARGCFDVFSYHNYGQQMEIETEWPAVEKLRAVMREFGEPDKPIWHTETGFFTGPVGLSEHEQAARIVRYSVGLLALGIERTFQLTLADWTDDPQHHDLSVYRGLTHADYRRKPSYAAYQTMCRRLGDKKFAAALRPASGVSGYLFARDDQTVLVAWRPGAARPVAGTLHVGTPLLLVQQMNGDWQMLREEGGVYELALGPDPIYLIDPGPPITNQRYVQWPNPVLTRIPRSSDAVIAARVRNPTEHPLVLHIQAEKVSSVSAPSEPILPGTEREIAVAVDASRLPVGAQEFAWALIRAGAQQGPQSVFAQGLRVVEVESPLRISFAPLTRLDAEGPTIWIEVVSVAPRAIAGRLTLSVGDEADKATRSIELKPGQTAGVALPFDPGRLTDASDVPIAATLEADGLTLTSQSLRRLIRCPRAPAAAQPDADLAEWRSSPPQIRPDMLRWQHVNTRQPPAADDLSASGWVAWDERGLWLALEVRDDRLEFPQAQAVWDWDSVQVALDLASDGRPGAGYDDDDVEIELGYRADAPPWCWLGACPAGWTQETLTARLQGAARPDEAGRAVAYELLIPAELVACAAGLAPDRVLGFSLLINDNDGDGRAGWLELTPGIGWGKEPSSFAWLWLR